jgi:hypothetical protein
MYSCCSKHSYCVKHRTNNAQVTLVNAKRYKHIFIYIFPNLESILTEVWICRKISVNLPHNIKFREKSIRDSRIVSCALADRQTEPFCCAPRGFANPPSKIWNSKFSYLTIKISLLGKDLRYPQGLRELVIWVVTLVLFRSTPRPSSDLPPSPSALVFRTINAPFLPSNGSSKPSHPGSPATSLTRPWRLSA